MALLIRSPSRRLVGENGFGDSVLSEGEFERFARFAVLLGDFEKWPLKNLFKLPL